MLIPYDKPIPFDHHLVVLVIIPALPKFCMMEMEYFGITTHEDLKSRRIPGGATISDINGANLFHGSVEECLLGIAGGGKFKQIALNGVATCMTYAEFVEKQLQEHLNELEEMRYW